MKRWPLLLSVALALVAVGGVFTPAPAAAGGSWSAWIYNQESGQLVHVFPDGAAADTRTFPLPPGTSQYPHELTISRDGALLAACLTDDAGNPSVRVYDIYNGVYIAAYIPSGPIQACLLDRYSFNADGSLLAFGILNHYPDPSDPRPDWELVVMQMHTSAILYRLDSRSPAITGLGRDYSGFVPSVSAFDEGVIAFKPIRWGTEGAPEYDSLVWRLSDGAVYMLGPYGKSSLDLLLPTGEAIWLEEHPSFSTGVLEGPGFLFNVVMYANRTGDHYPVFNLAHAVLNSARFIDDGRRVAVSSYAAPGPEVWLSFDRSGAASALPADVQGFDLWGTPDGYVFLNNNAPGGPQVRYHRFTGGPAPEAYLAWSGVPGGYWRIIWVNPLTDGEGLAPFPSIAPGLEEPAMPFLPSPGGLPLIPTLPGFSLSPMPTLPPPAVITPTSPGGLPLMPTLPGFSILSPMPTLPPPAVITPTLPPPPTLAVGGRARVHTTEGDRLRIRSGPGTSYPVLFQLPDGTPVTLLEGPVPGGEYTWWRIQTDDGRSGWAVEGVTDDGAYLQTLLPLP